MGNDSSPAKQATAKKIAIGCIAIVGLFFLLIIIIAIASSGGEPAPTGPRTGGVSDDVILNYNDDPSDCSGQVLVARTEEALDDSISAAVADDSLGQAELLLAERAFLTPNCTAAKVIDTKFGRSEVRLMEGDFIAQTGWVPYEFAITPPPEEEAPSIDTE